MPRTALEFHRLHIKHKAWHAIQREIQRHGLLSDAERDLDEIDRLFGGGVAG
jgi:hypothetical protein